MSQLSPTALKYLDNYAEAEARALLKASPAHQWNNVLVIPAYRESAELVARLQTQLQTQAAPWEAHNNLVILVLNQPASQTVDHNRDLRDTLMTLSRSETTGAGSLYQLCPEADVLLLERNEGLPDAEGVGLARKMGCDCALALQQSGRIGSRWIHTTDADVTLPADYFHCAETIHEHVAISHPFEHSPPTEPGLAAALAVYDLRLRYYVYGLNAAGSPYAFHTLGSCISVDADSYASVRGFPRRAGGEDFYLLNKLAKLGAIASPSGPQITIHGRRSDRVPFGTGPAITKLMAEGYTEGNAADTALGKTDLARLFYHPQSFHCLGSLLRALPALASGASLQETTALSERAVGVLKDMGIERAFEHCNRQASDEQAWIKHFHQWFDGFRTLKFIHGMRAAGLADMNLEESRVHAASVWPREL